MGCKGVAEGHVFGYGAYLHEHVILILEFHMHLSFYASRFRSEVLFQRHSVIVHTKDAAVVRSGRLPVSPSKFSPLKSSCPIGPPLWVVPKEEVKLSHKDVNC